MLVRLPDWWKKRPRPRVGITIGEQRRKTLDFDSLLDFRVGLALGDEELTEAEWQELMSAENGLVLLKGKWVEVDREQLTEALEHWKRVERESADGLSFVEGMRLWPARRRTWPTKTAWKPSGNGLSSKPENGWTRCWRICARRKICTRPGRKALNAELRPYQEVGVSWLSFLSEFGVGRVPGR